MEINCGKISENYLLIQNPLYAFSFPISVLVAIIIFGCAKTYKWSDNSYINQILIPILALLLTMVLIDMISRLMISNEKKMEITQMCNKWMNNQTKENFISSHPYVAAHPSNASNASHPSNASNASNASHPSHPSNASNASHKKQHKKTVEKMSNITDNNIVVNPIEEIPNISPFPIQSKPDGDMCIENSNGCNICSGSGKNPYNLVAPIPGPQWMPQSAATVQNRLKNNIYTSNKCPIN